MGNCASVKEEKDKVKIKGVTNEDKQKIIKNDTPERIVEMKDENKETKPHSPKSLMKKNLDISNDPESVDAKRRQNIAKSLKVLENIGYVQSKS